MAISPDSPRALLIVGMHRSGTSAAALALARMGWSLGADLLETQADINRDGFGENRRLVALNEKLLDHFGTAWFELFDWPADWEKTAEAGDFLKEAKIIFTEQFQGEQQILLKDPRLCLTLPFWMQALKEAGFAVRVILQWRHPQAVAQSLKSRDSLPIPAGLLLWLHYTLAAERWSRGVERAWLRYEDLLEHGAPSLALFDDVIVPESLDLGIDCELENQKVASFGQHNPLTVSCEALMQAIPIAEAPVKTPWDGMEEVDLTSLFNAFASSVTGLAAEAVSVGEQHSQALTVIAEKDQAIDQVNAYAQQYAAVVAKKDTEIAEVTRFARECEAVVAEKDTEIAEATRFARECEAAVAEKDTEIAEATRFARECEEAVKLKDMEILSKNVEIADATSRVDQLETLRRQWLYRLLRKLRLLR
ncbi:MAG: hypothetical protein VW865_07960 [Halieaceae bacterium]